MIDILLGGDNAVVIALACRQLPAHQRTKGILWGTAGAIVLRVILIAFALTLLQIPFLKLVGAALLLWIGVKLLTPHDEEEHSNIKSSDKLWAAVKTVIVADLVMSIDNVIAIAGAATGAGAQHQLPLVIFGLLVSIPIIVGGSQIVLKLMDRFPFIITLGGMLLGWIAGTMAHSDPAIKDWLPQTTTWSYGLGIAGALLVLLIGKLLMALRSATPTQPALAANAEHGPARLRRVLLAVDGSEPAARAVQHLIALRQALLAPNDLELHLINVQRPVSGDVTTFVSGETIDDYYRERSEKAFVPARALLQAAGLAYQEHRHVGVPGETIAKWAQDLDCDLIVMGTRGLGSHTGALLGSVAQGALEHSNVPVLTVK